MSLQHKQLWNRNSIKAGSFDRTPVVVRRFAILVSHIERRIKFGMQEKQSLCKLASEVQKSRLRVCSRKKLPTMLSFWIRVDLKLKTWQAKQPWKRSLGRIQINGTSQKFYLYKIYNTTLVNLVVDSLQQQTSYFLNKHVDFIGTWNQASQSCKLKK